MSLAIRRVNSLTDIAAAEWNRLAGDNPFLRHEYLAGLELHHCLDGQGWYPCHIVATMDGALAGAIPLYLKTNSIGEFVFDWNWAEAYQRAQKNYYPKLVSAIPFAPVTGNRILVREDYPEISALKQALVNAVIEWGREAGVSGGKVERVTWTTYAHDALGLLWHLGIERAFIMGACMGCSTAAAFAVTYPEAALGLVLHYPVGGVC